MADTKCIWFDEESEICLNGDCPVCADFCPLSEYKGVCKYEEYENRKMTNAGLIRAMSDEELISIIDCPYGIVSDMCFKKDTCYDCILKWLQQPAEEENNA